MFRAQTLNSPAEAKRACANCLLALVLMTGAACAWGGTQVGEEALTIQAFGDKPGLVLIVDDLMENLLADPRTRAFFENADQPHIKAMLVEQFCEQLGGPCRYAGEEMGKAHRRQKINTAHFYALVEDLQAAMDKHHVPFAAQNRLLAKLAAMHRQIITR